MSCLGDDPIFENSNDSSDVDQEKRSDSSLSFIKKKDLLYDKLDPTESESSKKRYVNSFDEPIIEEEKEEEVPLKGFEMYKRMRLCDKFLSGKVQSDLDSSMDIPPMPKIRRIRSNSIGCEPIHEEPWEGEIVSQRHHVFRLAKFPSTISEKSIN